MLDINHEQKKVVQDPKLSPVAPKEQKKKQHVTPEGQMLFGANNLFISPVKKTPTLKRIAAHQPGHLTNSNRRVHRIKKQAFEYPLPKVETIEANLQNEDDLLKLREIKEHSSSQSRSSASLGSQGHYEDLMNPTRLNQGFAYQDLVESQSPKSIKRTISSGDDIQPR